MTSPTTRTHVTRFACGTALTLLLASACGGSSFSNAGGSGAESGTGSGGSQSQAGSNSTAGKPGGSGGKASGGSGTTGGAPSGGSRPFDEACDAPAETGNCDAAMPRWFHDPSTGLCRPFTYGGCGGNPNNYETLAACQKACAGGSPNYDACVVASDCAITGSGCCGICDGEGITAHDLIAYNEKYREEVASCGRTDIACAPCPPPPLGSRTLHYFVPDCVQGQCVVEDLRQSPLTACQVTADCRLRNGSNCCEGCSNDQLISVRNDGSLEKRVCGGELQPCLPCEPIYPPEAFPVCEGGHCSVAFALDN